MSENLTQTPATTPSTTKQLLEKVEKKIIFSFLCFMGFFVVTLTAAIPFNIFIKAENKQDGSITSYIPVIVSSTFLLALLACAVALVILLSSADMKKELASSLQNNPNAPLEANLESGFKKICLYQKIALTFLVLPILINLILTLLTV